MATQLPMFHGLGERDRIMAAMRENSAIYLTALRSFAREYAMTHAEVCIDDVRRIMHERDFPMPSELGLRSGERIFGLVFSTKDFVPVREIVSTRPERIKRSGRAASRIWTYRLAHL